MVFRIIAIIVAEVFITFTVGLGIIEIISHFDERGGGHGVHNR